jgi:hypothetical protein
VRTAFTFDDSLLRLKESEARFDQRGVTSMQDDVSIASCDVAPRAGHLGFANCQLGTERCDVGSSGRDLTSHDGDVPTSWCHVLSRWCERTSSSRDFATSGAEAAIVACEVRSTYCLVTIDHCLVASMHAGVDSIIDGVAIDSCRAMSMRCDLARSRSHLSSRKHEARSDQCLLTSELRGLLVFRAHATCQAEGLTFGDSLPVLNESEACLDESAYMSAGEDVATSRGEVSPHRCSRRSTSLDFATGRAEAATVTRELRSTFGLVVIDHCLAATMHAHAMSTVDGPTIGWCRSVTATRGLARGPCHQSSNPCEARSNRCSLASEL